MSRIRLLQKPGQELEFRLTFNCNNENVIRLIDVASGGDLFAANSHFGGLRHYVLGVNTSNHARVIELHGVHKTTPPYQSNDWIESPSKQNRDGDYMAVGFEDAGDSDYNDALVTVTARPVGLGIGFPER